MKIILPRKALKNRYLVGLFLIKNLQRTTSQKHTDQPTLTIR